MDETDFSGTQDNATGSDGTAASDPFGGVDGTTGDVSGSYGQNPNSSGTGSDWFPSNADNGGTGLTGALSGIVHALAGTAAQPGGVLNTSGLVDAGGNLTSLGMVAILGGVVLVVMVAMGK